MEKTVIKPNGTAIDLRNISDSGWHKANPQEKPVITAKEFSDLKLKFCTARINQYMERTGATISDLNDKVNVRGGNLEIDQVVDADLHSSKAPDPTKYLFI